MASLIAGLLFLSTGEATLRILYRDGGRRTLGGPGNRPFEHLTVGPDERRGRRDLGPRREGVPRLLVLGDSITYGQGVRDWRDTWPEILATTLEREGHPHELAVFAAPGRNISEHLEELDRWSAVAQADVLIYQWYVNDIEVLPHRPDNTRVWQRWPSHEWLRRNSYLYFFFNHKASELLPPPSRSYADYIVDDFGPGTAEWAEFERVFHAFAMRAAAAAPRRLMILYPQVPFRGEYPLSPVHARMHAMAEPHVLAIPPAAWTRFAGRLVPDAQAPWGQALSLPAVAAGPIIETREYLLPAGPLDVTVTLNATDARSDAAVVALVELITGDSGEVVDRKALPAPRAVGGWQTVTLPMRLAPGPLRGVRFRVSATGQRAWALASLGIAVDYRFEVIDLSQPLNQFDTHASAFDAHPNEAAHRVIAEAVHRGLTLGRSR